MRAEIDARSPSSAQSNVPCRGAVAFDFDTPKVRPYATRDTLVAFHAIIYGMTETQHSMHIWDSEQV